MTEFLDTPSGRRIAYHKTHGEGIGIVFLGGFMSDMEGSKATAFEEWARSQGRPYLRFDYSGHGQSSEAFTDGCIGDWAEDARAAIEALTTGPQVLVGSSMGGWISLLMCQRIPEKVAGLVTIAAAPDFMTRGFWASFDDVQRAEVLEKGVTHVPSDYGEPYPITKRMIDDGAEQLILESPLEISVPVRMVQGTEDNAVTRETALTLLAHIRASNISLCLVKGGDHSFSAPENLRQVEGLITEVLSAANV